MHFRGSWWPLAAALLVLAAVLTALTCASIAATGGQFIYALDDWYTHMAIAKNLARHGVWGVMPTAFDGSGSSLAWPLVLAGVYRTIGVGTRAPFALNVVFAVSVLGLAAPILRRHVPSAPIRAAALIAIAVATRPPVLVITGMEHSLQVVSALALA